MQNEWQQFLSQHGASFDDKNCARFPFSTKEELNLLDKHCLISSLDHLGVLKVTGDDAQTFLQSQLSNDIKLLQDEQGHPLAQISAYCNPKGRILAQFTIIPSAEDYYLILSKDIIAKTIMRLRMFVLRSQVMIEDLSENIALLGVVGNDLPGIELAENDYGVIQQNDIHAVKIPSASSVRYLLLAPLNDAKSVWQNASDCTAVSMDVWQWLDIQAGLPNVVSSTIEEFVPQMLNLELINGVNFKKGCYPGQEIVARMHYLGKPKRRMFKLHANADTLPEPGTNLYIHGGDGQSAGIVVNSQPGPDNGIDLLAVIRLNHAGNEQLRLENRDGPAVSFGELPYSLETTD